jgi:transposase
VSPANAAFSTELKLAVVAETMQPGMLMSYVARRHGPSPSLVFPEAVRADDAVVAASEERRLEERCASWNGPLPGDTR